MRPLRDRGAPALYSTEVPVPPVHPGREVALLESDRAAAADRRVPPLAVVVAGGAALPAAQAGQRPRAPAARLRGIVISIASSLHSMPSAPNPYRAWWWRLHGPGGGLYSVSEEGSTAARAAGYKPERVVAWIETIGLRERA